MCVDVCISVCMVVHSSGYFSTCTAKHLRYATVNDDVRLYLCNWSLSGAAKGSGFNCLQMHTMITFKDRASSS